MNMQHCESTTVERLARLRAKMLADGIDAVLVPSADPHLSEYLPGYWQGRRWLSGFHGSVGTLVVTAEVAGLWADSRYWEQAQTELAGSGIDLMKLLPGQPGPLDWLGSEVVEGGVVAVDGAAMSLASARQLEEKLRPRGLTLRADRDPLDGVWVERPALPGATVYEHCAPYASLERGEKLRQVRERMRTNGADWHFLATLDDIAWLFNLRGSDVSYNPVFLAFALVGETRASLFVGSGKIPADLAVQLAEEGVEVLDYAQAGTALAQLPPGSRLLLDPARVTLGLLQHVSPAVERVEALNPSTLLKASKSAADAAHIRQAMEQDGAALCEFFAEFEAAQARGEVLTEVSVDELLTAQRARRPGFVSPSFATIAAFNANGAMPHYRATETSHARIEGNGLLLIDSGGQYLGGTTDITRMVPIGMPSNEQIDDCTRVLKGVIALSRAHFPKGIASPLLDAIARAPIWADHVDYGHGTGHGVGYFLNVHEGPQVIAYQAQALAQTAMQPGMITSIEPGTYRPGRWGVRIENLVLNQVAGGSEFGQYLRFETLTLCPIDTRCLNIAALNEAEREWLNEYHQMVEQRVAPLLGEAATRWLLERTRPV
ncbi:aminopeptidase P family protein [Pseudomonas sp. nanlin1]|uniref:aminopeptidase P family protein n=1 Tax=Pseudomonas sp. nanlin1 TaxID=3040605 RepID=UPI00388D0CBC